MYQRYYQDHNHPYGFGSLVHRYWREDILRISTPAINYRLAVVRVLLSAPGLPLAFITLRCYGIVLFSQTRYIAYMYYVRCQSLLVFVGL